MVTNPIQDTSWKAGNVSIGGSIVAVPSDCKEILIHASSSDYNNATYHLNKDALSATNKIFTIRGASQAIMSLLINSSAFAITQSVEPDGTDSSASAVASLYYR